MTRSLISTEGETAASSIDQTSTPWFLTIRNRVKGLTILPSGVLVLVHFFLCSELNSDHLSLLTDVTCWSSFKVPHFHHDITQLNRPAFCAGSRIIPRKCEEKINTCNENLISSVYLTEVVLALRFLICDHLGPRLPVNIQGKLLLAKRTEQQ